MGEKGSPRRVENGIEDEAGRGGNPIQRCGLMKGLARLGWFGSKFRAGFR